jgi:cytosine/adenosine deaminase-related metal-dependent hydrolase
MHRIIKNASLLLGRDLTFVNAGFIEIGKNGMITRAGSGNYNSKTRGGNGIRYEDSNDCTIMNSEGLLIIPGFINAHTHVGDSLGKDILVDYGGVNKRVHPVYGAKRIILQKSRPDHLKAFMRNSVISMMKKGIIAFADFREGECEGVELLKDAIFDLPIRCIVFGRIEYYFDLIGNLRITKEELMTRENCNTNITAKGMKNWIGQHTKERETDMKLPLTALLAASKVLKVADGLGISGANENTNSSFQQYRKLLQHINKKIRNKKYKNKKKKRKLLLAIHAAESKDSVEFSKSTTGKTEVTRIIRYLKPDIIVHMTNASDEDISLVAKKRTGVIVCPRANGILGAGIPKVAKMLRSGCIVGIGTDNVMINSPDIFREMDYIWKASRSIEPEFISARDILKMSTINGAKILGLNSGCIEAGRSADLLFIDKKHLDLYPIYNPYASIIHRASQDSIKGVMIGGKIVDGAEL